MQEFDSRFNPLKKKPAHMQAFIAHRNGHPPFIFVATGSIAARIVQVHLPPPFREPSFILDKVASDFHARNVDADGLNLGLLAPTCPSKLHPNGENFTNTTRAYKEVSSPHGTTSHIRI
jgi:hypothetical protein